MDEFNKQIIGYLLMAVIGCVIGLGIYAIGKFSLDPALIGILFVLLAALETAAYKWVKHNFAIPDELPSIITTAIGPETMEPTVLPKEVKPPLIIPEA